MKISAAFLRIVVACMPLLLGSAHAERGPLPVRVVLNTRGGGKLGRVVWLVQGHTCYVQVDFPAEPEGRPIKHPRLQLWLLRTDRSVIRPREEPMATGYGKRGSIVESLTYVFPPTARTEAVALAMEVDGQLFTESLLPAQDAEKEKAPSAFR